MSLRSRSECLLSHVPKFSKLDMLTCERLACRLFILTALLLASFAKFAHANNEEAGHVAVFTISGAISPASRDYLIRSMKKAQSEHARLFILKLDTPGGLDTSTRDIIKQILASPIPMITYVHPDGARAASAGTYILYASHLAAMTPSTTLGAATPVNIAAPALPNPTDKDEDKPENQAPSSKTTMEQKVLNDSIAFIRGLAKRHNRNQQWAEMSVIEAATLTASEAKEKNVINIVAKDLQDLLHQVEGISIMINASEYKITSSNLKVKHYNPDWRNNLLAIITNPQIAYILLMIGIYGLLLEGYNPGALFPGVIGAICLLISMYALQLLPVNYAGLALILFGILLITAEALSPSFGILGFGGVVATTIGSIILIDSDLPGLRISKFLIGSIAALSSIIVFIILFAIGRSLRMKKNSLSLAMNGEIGTVKSFDNGQGLMLVSGEIWNIRSEDELTPGDKAQVTSRQGLLLDVVASEENDHD